MIHTNTTHAWTISTLLLAACGGPATDHEPIALEDYAEAMARAQCAAWTGCCTPDERAALLPDGVTTEEECVTYWTTEYQTGLAPLVEAAEAGRIRYDAALAGDCYGRYESLTCEQFRMFEYGGATTEGCDLFVGLVEDGGACVTAPECASGSCTLTGSGTMGRCDDVPGLGEACTGRCEPGSLCSEGTCRAPRSNGEACTVGSECISYLCEAGVCAPQISSLCASPGS